MNRDKIIEQLADINKELKAGRNKHASVIRHHDSMLVSAPIHQLAELSDIIDRWHRNNETERLNLLKRNKYTLEIKLAQSFKKFYEIC